MIKKTTKYEVNLLAHEQEDLLQMIRQGKPKAREATRARILLKANEGYKDEEIALALDISTATVSRTRQRYVEAGLEAAVKDKPLPGRPNKFDGRQQAHLIALACTDAPDGHDHWTVRLLADKAVELGFVQSVSPETLRQLLKKNELKPWQHECWCIPKVSTEFVADMEDVLDLYELPYDPKRPMVCLDEKNKSLLAEVTQPEPVRPGRAARYDYEYSRNGTRNLFVMVEPLAGWRAVRVTEQRTRRDYAQVIRWLVDEKYKEAEKVVIVQDNLNTHSPASLYAAFAPAEARRILKRVEFHFTPKHGSWLNMAEIEIGIFERMALARRIGDEATLRAKVAALETERNAKGASINWQFTSSEARIKLKRLYPKLDEQT